MISKSAGATAVGTNDVSFLLPFINKKIYPNVTLSQQFIEEETFKQILNFEIVEGGKNTLTNKELIFKRENWVLTSFRFDPCFSEIQHIGFVKNTALIKSAEKCAPSLRLVFQPLNSQQVFVQSALHLVYSVGEINLSEVLNFLQLIKLETEKLSSTNNVGLTVHPGLLAEATNGGQTMQNLIIKLLTDFANRKKLVQMTGTLSTGVKSWKLVGGIVKDSSWKMAVTQYSLDQFSYESTEHVGVESFKCTVFDVCLATPIPNLNNENHLNGIFLPATATRPEIDRKNSDTLLRAEDIENPLKTNFFNTSCISCHVSSAYRNTNDIMNFDTNQYPKTQIPFTIKTNVNASPSSLINFGYEGEKPKISYRTANDSILSADKINKYLNADTSTLKEIKSIAQFWSCVIKVNSFVSCIDL